MLKIIISTVIFTALVLAMQAFAQTTQPTPVVVADGDVVVAPGSPVVVKEDPWGIVKWTGAVVAIIAAVRVMLLPAIGDIVTKVLEMYGDWKAKLAAVTEATRRQDVDIANLKKATGTGDGAPPPPGGL